MIFQSQPRRIIWEMNFDFWAEVHNSGLPLREAPLEKLSSLLLKDTDDD